MHSGLTRVAQPPSATAAATLAAEHRAGRRDLAATARQAVDQATRLQGAFNAFVEIDEVGAAARASELAGAPHEAGLLAGVPVSVKDILDVAGLPTRWGSLLFAKAQPAKADIAAVARLRAAGAVIVGKTTTTEFAHSPLATSPLTGLTRNPWAPTLTCGGSSAGAGVAVATGVTPVALATDAGCSTRLPAACTGTFGLKPTLGRIPHDRVPDGFGTFIHLGILTRNVGDLALALDVVTGPNALDPISLRATPTVVSARSASAHALSGKKILLWMTAGNRRVSDEVRLVTQRAADTLRDLGAEIVRAEYDLAHPDPIWRVLQQSNWASRFASASVEDRARLSPTLNAGIDEALAYSALDLSRAQGRRTDLFRAVQRLFGTESDFILTPCVSTAPVAAEFDLAQPLVIDGEEVGDLRSEWTPYLSLFDLTGHPALAMPAGLAANGGPLGVQLVGRWDGEADLLAAAALFEQRMPPAVWSVGAE